MSFWVSFCIGVVLSALQAAIKNPQSKEQLRARVKDIYDTIIMLYPEFQNPPTP